MDSLRQFYSRIAGLFRRRNLEAEMAEEMRLHLEQRIQEKIAEGQTPDDARYAAQREFGNVGLLQETARDEQRWNWLEQFLQDMRIGIRSLLRQRVFATVSILTLALGIGATTSIFSVINAVLLKPLSYEEPGQLVQAFEVNPNGSQNKVSPGVFMDWREAATHFEGFTIFTDADLNLTGIGEPERISCMKFSANGLQLLRARPVLGRTFAPDEDQAAKSKVIVLTYRCWQSRFGGTTDILGRTVSLNGEAYAVIGVLPAGFLQRESAQFVIPYVLDPKLRDHGSHFLSVYARLKPGVTVEQGRAELAAIAQRSKSLYPAWKKGWTSSLAPMQDQLARGIKPTLVILAAAVGLLLTIACTNVANLLLVRALSRAKEISVRIALGAGRARVIRQMLAESLLLSLLGGALGVLLALWATGALRHMVGALNFARPQEVTLDTTVLGAALAVSVVTGLVFGLVPALQASRPDLNVALKDAARGSAAGSHRLRSGLIIGEVALSLVLLVGAGLLLHSFYRLAKVSPGFNPEHAITMQLTLADAQYSDNARRVSFFSRAADRVASLPAVSAAGFVNHLQLNDNRSDRFFRIPGWAGDKEPGFDADDDICTTDWFRAMAIPLRRGRYFEAHDQPATDRVAVINEAMVRACFAGEDPIGRQLVTEEGAWRIVGVVGDIHARGLSVPARPTVYRLNSGDPWRNAFLVVRTATEPLVAVDAIRKALTEIDPTQPVADVRTLAEVVGSSLADRRLTFSLLVLFSLAALFLAGIGLYGVIAYAVGQRAREFGIRAALGATKIDVLVLVLRRGLVLTSVGVVCGIAAALALTRLLGRFLYEIKPTDPLTFVAVSGLLLVVALFASWFPARRAAKVDPTIVLRCD